MGEMTLRWRVREVTHTDANEWRRMRALLWPDADNDDDIARFFAGDTRVVSDGRGEAAVLVAEGEGGLGGFIEVGVRPFAAGCDGAVGYVEGWFVDEDLRRAGVGAALVRAAEAWARAHGCTEMASDCELENEGSLRAHLALGFQEYERVILFRKPI